MARIGQMVKVETQGGTVIGKVILTQEESDGETWHKVMVDAAQMAPGFAPWLKGETLWTVDLEPFASHAEGRRAIAFLDRGNR